MMNEIVTCRIGFEEIYNYSITVLKSSYVNLIKICFLRGVNGVYFLIFLDVSYCFEVFCVFLIACLVVNQKDAFFYRFLIQVRTNPLFRMNNGQKDLHLHFF